MQAADPLAIVWVTLELLEILEQSHNKTLSKVGHLKHFTRVVNSYVGG